MTPESLSPPRVKERGVDADALSTEHEASGQDGIDLQGTGHIAGIRGGLLESNDLLIPWGGERWERSQRANEAVGETVGQDAGGLIGRRHLERDDGNGVQT